MNRKFFPLSIQLCDKHFHFKRIQWNATDLNNEQKSAIANILKQTSYPHPYLLFGPPGTGKTKTLIEAIMQIIDNDNPNEFILVCATSNSACNEVAVRLLANVGPDKLFRIFAKSVAFNMAGIPRGLLAASNLQTGEHYYPSLQVIYQYKVSKNVKWSKRYWNAEFRCLFLRTTCVILKFEFEIGNFMHADHSRSIVARQNQSQTLFTCFH